ncbi:MAG: C-GCAxxG-C-C family protein, partial [Oscillospiraceae bacterium]
EYPENKAIIGKFMKEYEEKFTSTDCSVLNPMHQVEGERCISMVGETADFLEDFIKNYIEGNK